MLQLTQKLLYLSLFSSASCLAGILETGYQAEFNLYASGFYVASTTRQLLKTQDGMEYRTDTQAEGIAKWYTSDTLIEISKFKIENNTITAQSYRYQQTGDEGEKIVNIMFDHDNKNVRLSNESRMHTLHAESYDALSFQIALMQKLARGEKTLTVDVADQNGVFTYDANLAGNETIQTEIGTLDTLKILMKNRQNGNLFTFWCASKFDFLPVRIELERSDSGISSILEIQTTPKPVQ